MRAFYELLFSNDGGIPLEHCARIDDTRPCALDYNVVRWSKTELPPEAGVAVYVRDQSGKLAAACIYDDTDRPLGPLWPARAPRVSVRQLDRRRRATSRRLRTWPVRDTGSRRRCR